MSRLFRIKYMRFMAVLMAVAVFAGSVDTSILYVQAAQEDEADGGVSGNTVPYDVSDNAVSDNDIDDDSMDKGESGEDEDEPDEEDTKTQVTISGVNIYSKKYDGKAILYNVDGVTIKAATAEEDGDVTDVLKDELEYKYSGTRANGTKYPGKDETAETPPTDAGNYTLVVAVPDDNKQYKGSVEFEFIIEQRQIIVRAADVKLTMGEDIPEEYEYEVIEVDDDNPFKEEGGFIKEPTFTCDIESTDFPGEYSIIIASEADRADAGNNYNILYENGILTVSEPEPPKAKFLRIIPPAPVRNVPSGTLLPDIPLPETVEIVIENLAAQEGDLNEKRDTAAVEWSRVPIDGTSYSPSKSTEQTFKLGGTVILPDNVELPENAEEQSLNVTIEVNVQEKKESTEAVAAPTTSIPSGSLVQYGTAVELFCETEDAVIYYTLNGQEPIAAGIRYSGPIGIYGDVVIRAYAVKTGYPDSSVVKFSYYVNSTSGGGAGSEEGEPEVPKEDIPSDGVIPPGLWTPDVKSELVYTGKAIKPAVKVYDYKTLLTENKDYTVSYKNNVNAADASAAKAPTITITGKGNYEGKLTRTFTIKPKNISDTDVSIDDITVAYNKKAQKPSPTVMWGSKKLTKKKEYTVQDVSCTDVGSSTITVTGCGNYTGTRTFVFTITDGIPVSKLTVSKIPDQTYTGAEIEPTLTVKYKGRKLTFDQDDPGHQDYSVTYRNNKEVGTATAIIEGRGDYVGTRKVTFKIKEVASLSKAKIDVQFESTPVYTGRPITASSVTVTMNLKDENGQKVETALAENRDYAVTYQKNDKAGTATIVFTGMGAYRGTVKKTFKIAAYDMQSGNIVLSGLNSSYPYMKGGAKPEPTVKFGGTILKLGTDYTLSYKQNNAVGNEATVTVKGKGNFKGSISGRFEVTPQDISKMMVSAADKVYQNKKNIYKTTVRLTDTNGKVLKAGTDYDKNIEYTYGEDANVMNSVGGDISRKRGDAVDKDDIIPAGTLIQVVINAKGINYTGTTEPETYRIVGANISGAKVKIPTQTYTGKEIEPESQIQVVLKGQTLSSDDYRIVGYSNNINKGTAKVVLQGLGNYGGTKTATFKIKGKGLFN